MPTKIPNLSAPKFYNRTPVFPIKKPALNQSRQVFIIERDKN